MDGACSALLDPTNESRQGFSGGGGLNDTFSLRVNRGAAVRGRMRKIMCFLNINACKHFLDNAQTTSINLKVSIIWDM